MENIKEILLIFAKGAALAFFIFYTSFVIYGTYKLGLEIMMPFIKIEAGFIMVISLLVISHILGKYEKRLMDFANGGKQLKP